MNLSDLLQRCTVLIRCGEQGTGFFVAPNRVLTCAHVVKKDAKVSVEWGGQSYPGTIVQVFSKTYGDKVFPDVALIEVGIAGHPCVLLDREFGPNDDLYAFGFPGLIGGGETLVGVCEGFRQYVNGDPDTLLLKFKETQIKHGVSGAAVLNQRTGKVCGMMKTTRDDNTDLGGLAVRIERVFELLPELEEANRKFHLEDGAWRSLSGPRDDWFAPYKVALEQDFGKFTIPARVPLRDVYVEPKIQEAPQSPDAGMDKPRDKQDKTADAPASRTLSEVMAGAERKLLAIVGGPGQGKSTLLAHLALEWVEGLAESVPLMVRLRNYASQRSNFTEYLEKSSYSLPRERTEALLTAGKAMLLLDAFDEVAGDLRSVVVEDIRAAARKYPGAHIILTGRPASYGEMAAIPLEAVGFRRFELADFDDSQVREFLTKWGAWKKSPAEPLIRAIGESASFRRMAGKPLLLMIAASLQKVGNRAELYGEFVESLLEKWDRERGLVTTRADSLTSLKISVLEAVALDICEGHEGATATSIPDKKLEKLIKDVLRKEEGSADFETVDKILNGLRDRDSMLEEQDDGFEFVHRTMLEYFSARAYCTRFEESGSLAELETLFSDKWHFFWWDEILSLIGGSLREKALPLVRKLVDAAATGDDAFRASFRAADCLREMEPVAGAEDERQQIKGQLKKLLRYEFPYVYLPNDAETGQVVEIRALAADRLTYLPDQETRDILMSEVSRNENFWAASRMVPVVAAAWKDDRTLGWLKGLIERDGIAAVRIAAAREMARGWKTAEMREWLKASLAGHPDPQVRFAACWEIAADRKDEESRAALVKCAREDADQFVREEAMRVLVWLWWDAETEELLFDLAQNAKVWYARKAAILMLSTRSKQARVRALCMDRAVNDERWLLRHAALLAFRNWPDEESMRFVKERALTDHLPAMRGAAAYQLADVWPEAFREDEFSKQLQTETAVEAWVWFVRASAKVLSGSELDTALQMVAKGGQNPMIRATAAMEGAQKGTKEVWLPLLRQLAEQDGDAGIRRECVGMVARIDASDDVPAWLMERWQKDPDMGVREAVLREMGRRGGAVATTKDWMLGIVPDMMRPALANMAIYSLTRRWPDRGWLMQQRGLTPLQELARVWTDDETRAYLTKLAAENYGNEGGYESVRLLAWYWPDDQTRALLQGALTGGMSSAAMGAADSIAWRCHDEGIWQLLAGLARGNGDAMLRMALMSALAFQWREGRTRELLMELAVADPNLAIRQRAIWALGDQWNDEEMREFLSERAKAEGQDTRAGIEQILGRW